MSGYTTRTLPEPPISLLTGASLFLDFDGTMVEIAASPSAVTVTDDLLDLLALLHSRLDGRLAIVSGRSATEVEELLSPLQLDIAGSHGLETRTGGGAMRLARRPDILDSVASKLRSLARQHPGVLVEEKPLGVALHYRQAPDAEPACREAIARLADLADLEVQPGKMVLELRPRGSDKGAAVLAMMTGSRFAGTRPIYLGDDLTDEPAFAAAETLGGVGVLVGELRETSASYAIPTVGETLKWLRQAAEAGR